MLKFTRTERKEKKWSNSSMESVITYEEGDRKTTVYRSSSSVPSTPTHDYPIITDRTVKRQIIPENQTYIEELLKQNNNNNQRRIDYSKLVETGNHSFSYRDTDSSHYVKTRQEPEEYLIGWRSKKPSWKIQHRSTNKLTSVDVDENFSVPAKTKLRKCQSNIVCLRDNLTFNENQTFLNAAFAASSRHLDDDNWEDEHFTGIFRFDEMRKQVKRVSGKYRRSKSRITEELQSIQLPDEVGNFQLDEHEHSPTSCGSRSPQSSSYDSRSPQSSSASLTFSDRSFSDASEITGTNQSDGSNIRRANRTKFVRQKMISGFVAKIDNLEHDQFRSVSFEIDQHQAECVELPRKHHGNINSYLKADLLIKIFSYLPTTTLCRASSVCRRWYQLYLSPELWSTISITNFKRNIDDVINLLLQRLAFSSPYACLEIKSIQLNCCVQLTDQGLLLIAKRCPELRSIELQGCEQVTGNGLGSVLANCPNMAYINVCGCDRIIEFDILRKSRIKFGRHASFLELRYIDMSECTSISDQTLQYLTICAPFIEYLYIRRCDSISNEGLEALAENCRNLKELSLNECYNISDAGVEQLTKHCTKIRYLSLAKCAITDASVYSVAKYLKCLRHFNLHECEVVTDAGIVNISRGIRKLKSLDIGKCLNITDESLFALTRCKRLKRLCVKECTKITDSGLRKIARYCPLLRHIDLRMCDFGFETYLFLKENCKLCRIEHNRIEFC